jgi:hypothetical protein
MCSASRIIFMTWLCRSVQWQTILLAIYIYQSHNASCIRCEVQQGNSASKWYTAVVFAAFRTPEVYNNPFLNSHVSLWQNLIYRTFYGAKQSASRTLDDVSPVLSPANARLLLHQITWLGRHQVWQEMVYYYKRYIEVGLKKKLQWQYN